LPKPSVLENANPVRMSFLPGDPTKPVSALAAAFAMPVGIGSPHLLSV
jgi:hypothetical protein